MTIHLKYENLDDKPFMLFTKGMSNILVFPDRLEYVDATGQVKSVSIHQVLWIAP